MAVDEPMTEAGAAAERPAGTRSCPRCDEPLAPAARVRAHALSGVGVRRCARCGIRCTDSVPVKLVFSCETCGLPFETENVLARSEQNCPACADGRPPVSLPDTLVVRATENEVRAALASVWPFVTSPPLASYLERVTRRVATHVDGAPAASRVFLIDDEALRTLALPSGSLLLSVGMLRFLEDEAELAFVLGHELAHAASGDAAVRLVRLGFDAVARRQEAPTPEAWAEAALDLVRLGYGRKRERDADARALDAVAALEYDPGSVFRYLTRLERAIAADAPHVGELAVSHPPAADRRLRLERVLWGRVQDGRTLRVNREVYRRAVEREMSPAKLVPSSLPVGRSARGPEPSRGLEPAPEAAPRSIVPAILWAALAVGALLAGFLLFR